MSLSASSTISAILESAEFTISGRAAKDPDVRYLDGGKSVAKARIAVNTGKDSDPHWFTVEAWEQLAERLADSCTKGSLVIATGRITTNRWQTKTGEERTDLVIKARELKVLQPSGMPQRQAQAAAADAMPF